MSEQLQIDIYRLSKEFVELMFEVEWEEFTDEYIDEDKHFISSKIEKNIINGYSSYIKSYLEDILEYSNNEINNTNNYEDIRSYYSNINTKATTMINTLNTISKEVEKTNEMGVSM